jgi:hypothetical protein
MLKTKKNKTKNNKTQKRNCENKFCKLYTKKVIDFGKGLETKSEKKNKKIQQRIKNSAMKSCKVVFCNEGCKGTILEEGKKFPKLNKEIEIYDKKEIQDFRKELFKNKTNILIDNVQDKMPKRISKRYKKKGAISICEHYIPHGTLEALSKKIIE